MRATDTRVIVGSLRELSTVAVVVGLGTAYAVSLLGASDIVSRVGEAEGRGLGAALDIVAGVFIAIALFVSAIVIGTGVDTVIASRRQQLGLLRVVGASSRQLQIGVARAVAVVAMIGAGAGAGIGVTATALFRTAMVRTDRIPDLPYSTVPIGVLPAAAAMVAAAVVATLIATRTALGSTYPAPGSISAAVCTVRAPGRHRMRATAAAALLVGAVGVLIAACLRGERSGQEGFVIAFIGSVILAIAVLLGARYVVPPVVRLVGAALGHGPAGLVARKNAAGDPLRTTRATIGLLIGVTLVTTIAAGMYSLDTVVSAVEGLSAEQAADNARVLSIMTAVLIAMVAISAVIAAVGFVSTMSLTVITRAREIGMLRAMGFTAGQVRSMITRESIALSTAAVATGLVLGTLLGAVGTQSLLGSSTEGLTIGLPPSTLAAIVAATVGVVVAASVPPARRAIRVSPVDALAIA